jgi:hypothetical protein
VHDVPAIDPEVVLLVPLAMTTLVDSQNFAREERFSVAQVMVYADLVARASPATVSHMSVQNWEDKYWEARNVEDQEILRVAVEWRANGTKIVDTLVQDVTDTWSVAYSAEWAAKVVEFLETLTDVVVSLETA